MTPAWKTAEFWTAMVGNIVGALVLLGIVTPDQQNALVQGAGQLAGALIVIIPNIVAIASRAATRRAVAVATIQATASSGSGGEVGAMGIKEDIGAVVQRIKNAMRELGI